MQNLLERKMSPHFYVLPKKRRQGRKEVSPVEQVSYQTCNILKPQKLDSVEAYDSTETVLEKT
jgi:hypothetical protein